MLRKKIIEQKINLKGFSLIEVLVSILILAMLTLGIYSLISLSVKISTENQHYVEATEIANQHMEKIRNMPYDSVGTVGNPSAPGILPQTETVVQQGTYTVNNWVAFYDDSFDGTAASSTDAIPNDYKIATIKVSWLGHFSQESVTIFSKIIPKTMETFAGYGLLAVTVTDANGAPVPSDAINPTNIEVKNTASGTDATYPADNTGHLYLPVPAAYQGYQVIVTKNNYSQDKTFPIGDSYNPHPLAQYTNVTVVQGEEGACALTIDKLATLNIQTVSAANLPVNWKVNQAITGSTKNFVKMAADNSGNLYFTWQNTNATSTSIFVQKYNSSQAKQWTNDVEVYNTGWQSHPGIATTKNGQSFVVWQDNSLPLKQLLAFKNSNPIANDTQFAVATNNNDSNNVQVAVADNPGFFSVWKQKIISGLSGFKKQLAYLGGLLSNQTSSIYRLAVNLFPSENNIYKLNNLNISNSEAASTAVTSVNTTQGNTRNNGKSITLSVPSGVQANDLLVAFLYMNSTSDTFTTPSGWNALNTNLQPSGGWAGIGAIFYKFVATGNPSSYAFTVSGSNTYLAGDIRAYRYADYLSPTPFSGSLVSTTTTSGTTRLAPSTTVALNGSMLVSGWGAANQNLGNSGTATFPTGMSNTRNDNTTNVAALSAEQSVDSGSTGNKTLTIGGLGSFKSINWSLIINPLNYLTASATGTQKSSLTIASSSQYVGGAFVITDNTGAHTITSIKIQQNGTASSTSDISNVKLFYDLDATSPYDCSSESFNGTEAQFGSAASFDSSNTATFSGSTAINTTQTMCVYVVLDVPSTAARSNTINFSIANPSADIINANSSLVSPATAVALNGTTLLQKQGEALLAHYRWRNDNGSETSATWTNLEDTPIAATQNNIIRLRMEVSNDGDLSTDSTAYRLEYGLKQTTCAAITSWQAVSTDASANWQMVNSAYLTDDAATTNSSGLDDANSTFQPGYAKDTGNQTPAITLSSAQFTEIEYSIEPNSNATSSVYCFRLTNAGSTDNFNYSVYPEAAVVGNDNIYIKSLDSNGNTLWTKKVNSLNDSFEHIYPVIAYTENFGTATSVIAWEDYRNGNSDIYIQSFDYNGNRLWGNDLSIVSTANNEYMTSMIIDANDNLYVAWVANESSLERIHLQKFALDGSAIWASPVSISGSAINQYSPTLSRGESDNIYLAWTEDNGSGTDKNAKIAKFDASGNILWSGFANVANSSNNQYEPSLIFGNSYAYVSWTDDREGNEDIYTQKFDTSGNAQWTATGDQRININTDTFSQNNSNIIIDSAGDLFGAWSDQRNGSSSSDIYATKFSDPGTPSGVSNVPLTIQGAKIISAAGYPNVLKYSSVQTTNSSGNLTLGLEFDTYTIDTVSASTSLKIKYASPAQPIPLSPAGNQTIQIYVQ